MPRRIVVTFRGPIATELDVGKRYLDRALSLKKRAEALGATLCAWSAATFSFDFGPDELEEAASLALSAQEGMRDDERFGIGIAEGEMSTVGEGGSMAALSWGLPLCAAVALSRDAKVGEALLDPDLVSEHFANLAELGYEVSLSGPKRVLSARHPALLAATAATEPPPPSRARPLPVKATAGPPSSSAWPSLRPPSMSGAAMAGASSSGPSSNGPSSTGATLHPSPAPAIAIPRAPSVPSLPLSSAITAPPPPRPVSAGPPSQRPAALIPPPPLAPRGNTLPPPPSVRAPRFPSDPGALESEVPDHLAELAKRALIQGDMSALEGLIAQLRVRGEHGDLVERMTGLAALRRGATAEALRRLRAAAEAKKDPSQQAKARLAYGVALATAGRNESALLEVLDALSRARAASDQQGERACALFLARLSTAAGHADAASAWTSIARKPEPTAPG